MADIWIKKEKRKYIATCDQYESLCYEGKSYEEVRDMMVEQIHKIEDPKIVVLEEEPERIAVGFY